MRVLLLTQVLPYPPDSGPKVKTWNVLKFLSQHHEVTLISFVRGDQSRDIVRLQRYCQAIHTIPMERGIRPEAKALTQSFLGKGPWMMLRDSRQGMCRLIDHVTQQTCYDLVHADQLNMAQYAYRVQSAFRLLDAHNALWLLYKRMATTMRASPRKWLLERDWHLLKHYEGQVVRNFDAVLAVSEEDKAALLEAAGVQREITVIPIAVDVEEITPVERVPYPMHILHIGTMYWPPNIDGVLWFAREIYPLIRKECPDVQFDIIGARPPKEVRALHSQDTGINVTGYVADPTPYLTQTAVMVVPLRAGSGMRVKILNAMAQGIPIVSTTLGYEGIEVTPGRDILVGDTPETFANEVLRVLRDPSLGAQLAIHGRHLVTAKYDYRRVCKPLEEVYARVGT